MHSARLVLIGLLENDYLCCGCQGAVNLSIKTLYVPNRDAVVILILYLAVLCGGVTAAAAWREGRSSAGPAGPGAAKAQ